MFRLSPQDLLFGLSILLTLLHYLLVFLSDNRNISPEYIKWSGDLVKFVVGAWVGSVVGGVAA